MKNEEIIYNDIKILLEENRNRVYKIINTEMINLYWNIGRIINNNSKYITKDFSHKLVNNFGKQLSISNLNNMNKFYNYYKVNSSLMNSLTWSHYLELLKIEEKHKRDFYMIECLKLNWSSNELQKQISSKLYENLILIKNQKRKLSILKNKYDLNNTKDIIKNPYILDYLNIELKKENL